MLLVFNYALSTSLDLFFSYSSAVSINSFVFQKLSQVPPLHEIAEKHISTKAVL